mgnify:CR=1 FL=1
MSEPRRLSLARLFAFSLLMTFGLLFGLNALVEQAEDAGVINTTAELGATQMVVEELFTQQGGFWLTTPYGEESMMPARVPVERGAGYRVAVVGGSWAMGSPYVVQQALLRGGGMVDFLRISLEQGARVPIEVINAASGGQDSHRVRAVAAEVVKLQPDVLVVATCNNEGTPGPSHVQRFLAQQASVRLLMTLGREPERSWFTAQDPDSEAIRRAFVENLEAIVESARRAAVPVLLATLPVNLDYPGFGLGHIAAGGITPPSPEPSAELLGEPEPMPEGFDGDSMPPCLAGVRLAEVGRADLGVPLLQRCLSQEGGDPYFRRLAPNYLAMGRLRRGETTPAARERLAHRFSPCIAQGIEHVVAGRGEEAEARLRTCTEDLAESLRWLGFALQLQSKETEAGDALRQSVELKPRNRCRPTFNEEIRQVAARHEHVDLVDLERAFESLPPPATDTPWFIDYCHMSWRGYAAMGRSVFAALAARPGFPLAADAQPLSDDVFQSALTLPSGDGVAQWRALLDGWFRPPLTPQPTPPPAETPPPPPP